MRVVMLPGLALLCLPVLVFSQRPESGPVKVFSQVARADDSSGNPFRFVRNPALLSGSTDAAIGVAATRKYGINGLGDYTVAGSIPTISGGFGLFLAYSGSSLYNSSIAALSYGRGLGRQFHIGLGFEAAQVSIRGYGKIITLRIRPGLLVALAPQMLFGAGIDMPAIRDKVQHGTIVCSGLSYRFSPQLILGMEIQNQPDNDAAISVVINYRPLSALFLRFGLDSGIPGGWLSAGWMIGACRFDVTGQYHSRLGLSPGVMFRFCPRKKIKGGTE